MKNLYNISLYLSSFIPLYFLIIIKELTEIINGNLSFTITNIAMLTLNALFIIAGLIGIFCTIYKKDYKQIEIIEYKNITCENFFPYFPLFVLFAIAFELEFISMALIYLFIIIMVGIVYIKNNMYYINPFLNIIGFSTYEVTFKQNNAIITNKKLFMLKKISKGKTLANNLFLK